MNNENTLTVLHELDDTLQALKKKYENESVFADLVVLGINAANGKVRDKIVELTVANTIAEATAVRNKYD